MRTPEAHETANDSRRLIDVLRTRLDRAEAKLKEYELEWDETISAYAFNPRSK